MPKSATQRLIIFTRYPEPGKTKTRLIPALGAEGAANLQRRMTERIVDVARDLRASRPIDLEIRFEGGSWKRLQAWLGVDTLLTAQGTGGLGRRMRVAFADAFAGGCQSVVIIGTDIPDISAGILGSAFERLGSKDLVLGPAVDGGYYLIGLRRSAFDRADDLLSSAIPWGSDTVLQTTLSTAADKRLSVALLDTLQDVDRPEDLSVTTKRLPGRTRNGSSDRISVVIPTLNEARSIQAALLSLQGGRNMEVIVADGGSGDETAEIARQTGAAVLQTVRGRAAQMNAGAAAATGDILLFLHADTRVPPGFDRHVRLLIRQPGVSAGAFELRIDSPVRSLRAMERVANLRSHIFQMVYGDQGIFVTATIFREVGGIPDMPIMEDFEFARRLKKKGRIEIAPAAVQTSARRWLSVGVWRTWWINQLMVAGYLLGVSPQRLTRLYRRESGLN